MKLLMQTIFPWLKELWVQVLIGLVLGVVAGLLLQEHAESLKFFGNLFIKLIKMVIVPLIFFALLSGITSIGEGDNFARIGVKSLFAYIITAMFAVVIGLFAGTIFKPGIGIDLSDIASGSNELSSAAHDAPSSASDFILNLIPSNPINAMASDNFLQLIVFTIFIGMSINLIDREKSRPIKQLINSAAQVMFKMIGGIVRVAPIGVFGFVAWVIGVQGLDILLSLGKLVVTVLIACLFQYIVFGLMLFFIGRISPFPFYKKMLFTQSLAFATSSSKATLSTAMEELKNKMGVSKVSTNFVLPLGACINMDGTAIYLGITAVFFSQASGINLDMQDYLMLVLTCTLGSIGAAGIPSGSIIFMGMVLTSIGLPVEGIAVILGVDRILDMIRTMINITGDSTITLMIDSTEKTLDKKLYYSKTVDNIEHNKSSKN